MTTALKREAIQRMMKQADLFQDLDVDHSGFLDPTELDNPFVFDSLDRDGDGLISPEEFYGDEIQELFGMLDPDGDGYITRDEWKGTGPAFDALDTDRDGVITIREFAVGLGLV